MKTMQKVWTAVLGGALAGVLGTAALPSEALSKKPCDGSNGNLCPLQKWARNNIGTPMASGDLAAVAKGIERIQNAGGPDMKDWGKMARKTIDDLRANKTDDVKADCKSCHDAYKEAFKANVALRNKPLP